MKLTNARQLKTCLISMLFTLLLFSPGKAWAWRDVSTSTICYELGSVADLERFATSIKEGKKYSAKLACDIDLSDLTSFTPIGSASQPFTGEFDGQGFTIKGLKIRGKQYLGLFGAVKGAKIKHLHLKNASYTINPEANIEAYCGGICGYVASGATTDTEITDCEFSGTITGESSFWFIKGIGGICGVNDGSVKIKSCTFANQSKIKIQGYGVGGILGIARNNADIDLCFPNGTIECQGGDGMHGVGGIVGDVSSMTSTTIKNCVLRPRLKVTGLTDYLGTTPAQNIGLVCGYSAGALTVEDCKANLNDGDFNCDNTTDNVGGICGYSKDKLTIRRCFTHYSVTARNNVGGLCGKADGYNQIELCTCDNKITATNYAGGIIGSSSSTGSGYIRHCNVYTSSLNSDGSITCSSGRAAGIIAYNTNINNINNCLVETSINGATKSAISISSTGSIQNGTNCYSKNSAGYYLVSTGAKIDQAKMCTSLNNDRPVWENYNTRVLLKTEIESGIYDWCQKGHHTFGDDNICTVCGVRKTFECIDGVYEISTVEDLYMFGIIVNVYDNATANAILKNDIKINANVLKQDGTLNTSASSSFREWIPIGILYHNYKGTFNGKGHSISGLYINSDQPYRGLFGIVEGATITNLKLKDAYISSSYEVSDGCIGSFCGKASSSKISNCVFNGTIKGKWNVGGFCGLANGLTTSDCSSNGNISGSHYVGGIVGQVSGFENKINNCQNFAKISAETKAAGIVAGNEKISGFTDITNCSNNATITGGDNCSGILGYTYGAAVYNSKIESCYSLYNGIKPANTTLGSITNCYYKSDTYIAENNGQTGCTEDLFNNGVVCWLLNEKNESSSAVWRQNLSTDKYPSFTGNVVTHKTMVCSHPSVSNKVCDLCGYVHLTQENGFYLINDLADLKSFIYLINDGESTINGKLTKDIVINNSLLSANGSLNTTNPVQIETAKLAYKGTFDGNGKTIKGLYIKSNNDRVGLFSELEGGTILNLKIDDAYIEKYGSTAGSVGGICAYAKAATYYNSTLSNCQFSGKIVSNSDYVGGICGYANGTADKKTKIFYCKSAGTITSSANYVGGICGYLANASITACQNEATVSGADYVGGICAAKGSNASIDYCFNAASVTSNGLAAGIIPTDLNVLRCYNIGKINGNTVYPIAGKSNLSFTLGDKRDIDNGIFTAKDFASGVVCWLLNDKKETDDVVWRQNLSTDKYPTFAGAIVKRSDFECEHAYDDNYLCKICDANYFKIVDGYYQIDNADKLRAFAALVNKGKDGFFNGELVADIVLNNNVLNANGQLNTTKSFESWTPIGKSTFSQYKGTFKGNNHTVSGIYIEDSDQSSGLFGYVLNSVIGDLNIADSYIKSSSYCGLLAGEAENTTIESCNVQGSIIGSGNGVGGLCGRFHGGKGIIQECSSSSSITSKTENTGGICGVSIASTLSTNVTISDCIFSGKINSESNNVGGICGYTEHTSISRCFNTGELTGLDYIGGICGKLTTTSNISNCYNAGSLTATNNVYGIAYIKDQNISQQSHINYCYNRGKLNAQKAYPCNSSNSCYLSETLNPAEGAYTEKEFASGVVCWLLNDKKETGNVVWRQNLSTDKYPTFAGAIVKRSDFECEHSYNELYICQICDYHLFNIIDDYYQIDNAEKLRAFADIVNNGIYKGKINAELTADIDISNTSMQPIGSKDTKFAGTFKGNNHKIIGLRIDTDQPYTGLFGYTNNATISDINIVDADIKSTANYVGTLIGYDDNSTITNCISDGFTLESSGENTGGLCGYALRTKISDCTVSGILKVQKDNVGGICGQATSATISNCRMLGSITGSNSKYVGGICGNLSHSTISLCLNNGTIKGSDFVGGICGCINNSAINNCYNQNKVTATTTAAGISAATSNSEVTNCYSSGILTAAKKFPISAGVYTNSYYLSSTVTEDGGRTLELFNNGTVCWNLNNRQETSDVVWKQKKGVDKYPSFKGDVITAADFKCSHFYDSYDLCILCGEYKGIEIQDNCYIVKSANDLIHISRLVSQGNTNLVAKLANNIVLNTNVHAANPIEFPRIGTDEHPFEGHFYGQGHTISGLVGYGLFGTVRDALISNVHLTNASLHSSHNNNTGGICGKVLKSPTNGITIITNCSFAGEINLPNYECAQYIGSICGVTDGETIIEKCEAKNISIKASSSYVGGILGYASAKISIISCSMSGNITTLGGEFSLTDESVCMFNTPYIGGLIGRAQGVAIIKDCNVQPNIRVGEKNTGFDTRYGSCVGGLCGATEGTTEITNCKVSGSGSIICVGTASNSVGGLCGLSSAGLTITNCYNKLNVSAGKYVGGLCGQINSKGCTNTIEHSYNEGQITAYDQFAAGLVGFIDSEETNSVKIINCYSLFKNTKDCGVSATNRNAAGIVNYRGKVIIRIENSYSYAKVCASTNANKFFNEFSSTAGAADLTIKNSYFLDLTSNTTGGRTEAQFKDGTVCNALNGSGDVWSQGTIAPVLSDLVCKHEFDSHKLCVICGESLPLEEVDNYYRIYNAQQLKEFDKVLKNNQAANARLEADIILNENLLNADGTAVNEGVFEQWTPFNSFSGTFDGNGHSIYGLYIADDDNYAGLLKYSRGATFKNLNIKDSYFRGKRVGGFCYEIELTENRKTVFEQCSFEGVLEAIGYAGGLAGVVCDSVLVTNCYTKVVSETNARGLFGTYFYSSDAEACIRGFYTTGKPVGSAKEQSRCYYLSDQYNDYGGLSAEQFESGLVCWLLNDKKTTGNVVWRQNKGDKFPSFEGDIVTDVKCNHEGGHSICKLCGYLSLTDGWCLIYTSDELVDFINYINKGSNKNVNAKLMDGIFLAKECGKDIGSLEPINDYSGTFDGNGHSIYDLYINTPDASEVGFIGRGNGCTIKNLEFRNSYLNGQIAGGICGSGSATIENCSFKGTVKGYWNAGGIVGSIAEKDVTTITDCYAVVDDIQALSEYGCTSGILGYVGQGTANIRNCYAVSDCAYPIVGAPELASNPVSIENCYYLEKASAIPTEGVTARTAEQFANGTVAYELGEAWGQTIGTDKYPVLGGEKVYMISGNCYNEGATISKLILDDEHDFAMEGNVKISAVEYTRHITNNWNSICLPFGFSVDGRADKVQLFVVEEMDGETVVIRQVTSVEAGQPAILYMPNIVDFTISASNPTLTGAPDALGDMVGNFSRTVVTDANSYYLKGNSFKQCNGNFTLLPYRAYVPGMGGNGNSLLSFRIVGDNDDVMEDVEDENADKQIRYIFNTMGQQVERMDENGVYILMFSDGSTRKVVIK